MILKSICMLTSALMLTVMMSGCGNQNDGSSVIEQNSSTAVTKENKETETVKNILSQINNEKLDAEAYIGEEVFRANCENLYGVAQDKFADAGIIYASGGGFADEISMLKPADDTDCEEILTKRLESRCVTFENYKPEEMDKLNKAEIYQLEDYWILIISDDLESLKSDINNLIK